MLPVKKLDKSISLDTIHRLEKAMVDTFPTMDPADHTDHFFCEGMYARQMTVPENSLIVGKMHKEENFFILVKGTMSVYADGEMKKVTGPFMTVTKPGEKRVGYAHTECVTINFHPNPDNETNMALLEDRYTVPPEMERLFREDPKRLERK